jgi:hypothetical protein
MFIPPIELCTVCKQYVVLTQTQQECAEGCGCAIQRCPLAHRFLAGQVAKQPAAYASPEESPLVRS